MANEYTNPAFQNESPEKPFSITERFIFKVYIYLAVALALAGITGIIISYIFQSLYETNDPNLSTYWLISFVCSFVLIFVFTLIINIQSIRNRNSVILLSLYAITWGLFLGCFVFLLDNPLLIGGAFLISAVIFIGASGIGYIMGGKAHRVLSMVAGGLLIGAMLCSLLTFVVIPFALFGGYTEAYWSLVWLYLLIQGIILLYMVITVSVMTYRIRHMDQAKLPVEVKNSLAVSVAISLFSTFINVFLRVLYILLLFFGGSSKK